MEDIYFSGLPLLEGVGSHEPFVEELRETVRNAIAKSLIPMKAYARQYKKYLSIMNLDIASYIKYDLDVLTSYICCLSGHLRPSDIVLKQLIHDHLYNGVILTQLLGDRFTVDKPCAD